MFSVLAPMLHRYDPPPVARKEVTHEDMVETLKRKVREATEKHALRVSGGKALDDLPGSSAGTATTDVKPPIAALQWEKPVRTSKDGLGFQRSTCGRFCIAKVRVGPDFQYTASRVNRDSPAAVLGSRRTPEAAKALCEESHAR